MAVKSPASSFACSMARLACVGCLRTRVEARKMTDFRPHQILNERSRREQKLERAYALLDATQRLTPALTARASCAFR
jgi:predicted Fe-S protein YdhL (DUF1289 family)